MDIKQKTILNEEPYLRQISKEVDLGKNNIEEDIKILKDYCENHEVMAMASVQLGIPKRIIYLKNTNLDIINKMQYDTATKKRKVI